jgi:predicted unusual protein kinase regulating ubiquinone biosynthesis (AarF/ABC1/UbiB family)
VCKFLVEIQVRVAFQKDKEQVGEWMKNEFGNLGPAFVKFGQFLSTRNDLF